MLSVSSTLGYPAGCSHAHLSPAPARALSSSRQPASQQGEAGVRQLAARAKPPRPWGSGGRHRSSKEHRRPAAAQADWNNKQTEGRGALSEFRQNHRWRKPESGMLKLNSDRAFDGTRKEGGWGFATRGELGKVVVSGGGCEDHLLDAFHAEVLGCLAGLQVCK